MKLKYIFGMVAAVGLMNSCDVTDKKPIDSFTDESYWTKVSDLKYYANGLYDNLDSTMVNASNLLIDLKKNPKRYVHFSVF